MPVSLASTGAATTHGALVPIGYQTVSGSSTGTVTFSNIPQGYQDLMVVCNFALSAAYRLYIRYNNDSSQLYSDTYLSGDGSGAASYRDSGSLNAATIGGGINGITQTLTASETIHILNYANTSTYKTCITRLANDKNGSGSVDLNVALYRSTSAITAVNIVGGANFVSGSTFALYGVRTVNQ